jgi:hypothetical protein
MSGGGAGKVYFVLYLAVVLELLIIIVERDEAEEHLQSKQKETMKIVESILSQLQAGAGSEGINTRPQDEITIPPEGNTKELLGFEIKPDRTYLIEVGVTDVSSDLGKREGENEKDYLERIKKLIKLGNVMDLEYQIFFNSSDDPYNAPEFPSEEYIRDNKIDFATYQPGQQFGENPTVTWQFMGMQRMLLDEDASFNKLNLKNIKLEDFEPVYPLSKRTIIGPTYAPPNVSPDSIFFYSKEETKYRGGSSKDSKVAKRVFSVKFQPDKSKGGWYKLRFNSRTSRILGVKAGSKPSEVSDETKVNIGTVQLAVKDLRKVMKELALKLEEYNLPSSDMLIEQGKYDQFIKAMKEAKDRAVKKAEDPQTAASNIDLYGYIVQLLAPGQSVNFKQNKGSIDFNIRVVKPDVQTAAPVITLKPIFKFEEDETPIDFDISPYNYPDNRIEGSILKNGSEIAKLKNIQPLTEYLGKGLPDMGMYRNKSVRYIGMSDRKLEPGQYEVVIRHAFRGKNAEEKTSLEICEAKLAKKNEERISNLIKSRSFYGNEIFFGAVPACEGIAANEFKMYLKTNNKQINQSGYINGLDIASGSGLKLCADDETIDARIVWIDPITNKEIELFKASAEVKQQEPTVSFMRAKTTYKSNGLEEGEIEISGIQVLSSLQSCESSDYATLDIVGNASGDISGRTPNSKYSYKLGTAKTRSNYEKGAMTGEVTVIIPCRLAPNETINRRDKQIALSGSVNVSISVTAVNEKNRKRSRTPSPSQNYNISTTISAKK